MAYMSLRTAPIHIFILHAKHCTVPVVQHILFTLIYCLFIRGTFPHCLQGLYKLFLFTLVKCLPQSPLYLIGIIQHLVCRFVDVFHQVVFIHYHNTFINVGYPRLNPCSAISADIYLFQIFCLIIRLDIFLHASK